MYTFLHQAEYYLSGKSETGVIIKNNSDVYGGLFKKLFKKDQTGEQTQEFQLITQ